MRAVRNASVFLLCGAALLPVACQEPTQVTIDVRLITAQCSEVHGTAINVGIHPEDTEEKVRSKFPTAQTTDCDPAMTPARIGTLVITPNDEERASIVVVASYGNRRDPTECQPPDYKDCIVARRQFSFSKHRRLYMPITIDPTCVNVPCDAFSTCRKGFCFSAEAPACEGQDCEEPGEVGDGGTNTEASVTPDAPVTTDGPPPAPFCQGTALTCGDKTCAAGEQCCSLQTGVACRPSSLSCVRVCCSAADCTGVGSGRCSSNGSLKGAPDAAPVDEDGATVPPPDATVNDSGPSFDSGSFDSGSFNDSGSAFDAGGAGDSGTVTDGGGAPPGLGICQ